MLRSIDAHSVEQGTKKFHNEGRLEPSTFTSQDDSGWVIVSENPYIPSNLTDEGYRQLIESPGYRKQCDETEKMIEDFMLYGGLPAGREEQHEEEKIVNGEPVQNSSSVVGEEKGEKGTGGTGRRNIVGFFSGLKEKLLGGKDLVRRGE